MAHSLVMAAGYGAASSPLRGRLVARVVGALGVSRPSRLTRGGSLCSNQPNSASRPTSPASEHRLRRARCASQQARLKHQQVSHEQIVLSQPGGKGRRRQRAIGDGVEEGVVCGSAPVGWKLLEQSRRDHCRGAGHVRAGAADGLRSTRRPRATCRTNATTKLGSDAPSQGAMPATLSAGTPEMVR